MTESIISSRFQFGSIMISHEVATAFGRAIRQHRILPLSGANKHPLKLRCVEQRYTYTAKHSSHSSSLSNYPQLPKRATLQDPIRKILYAFDPSDIKPDQSTPHAFPFLHPASSSQCCALSNINYVDPAPRGVPWPSTLPGSLQSRYWVEGEEAATEFARMINKGRLNNASSERHIDVVVDTAVHFVINLIPGGNLTRTKLLAKACVLLFMHDDAIDTGNYDAMIPALNERSLTGQSNRLGFDTVAREILLEDPKQGRRMLEGFLLWGTATQKPRPEIFSNLEEYMEHRVEDVGADTIFRTIEFSCGVHFPDYDSPPLGRLRLLCAKHFLLVNDLYSYEKEARAEAKNGEALFNAVRVVQNLMGSSIQAARIIVRQVILDVERQMAELYSCLERSKETGHSQLTYAQGLIALTAGNIFFCATSPRYARVVDGSKLA